MASESLEQRIAEAFNDCASHNCRTCIATLVRSELKRAAEIARHFANDKLTPEEYPPYGMTYGKNRSDMGASEKVANSIAQAIERLME